MKNLKTGYVMVTTFVMITSLLSLPMRDNLRKVQIDELKSLDKLSDSRQLTVVESNYVKTLYQNFVLNNFRFEDKQQEIKKPQQQFKQQHIGMMMLNNM